MTAAVMEAAADGGEAAAARVDARRVFLQVLWRDVYVTLRSLPTFFAQVILQPLFLVFIFGKVLSQLGYVRPGYADLLLPGVIALTCVLTGLQGTALPMVIDFSYTREIEDRLMAPLPTAAVALEKVVFGALRGLVAGLVMFPVGWLVLGHVPFVPTRLPLLIVVILLATIVGSAMGLTLGSLVEPDQINIVFALVLTPLLFTGCSQYPWPSLSSLPWFKVVTLFNPLTYASEGMRASMEPSVAHMNPVGAVAVLLGSCALFTALGVWGFRRRALD